MTIMMILKRNSPAACHTNKHDIHDEDDKEEDVKLKYEYLDITAKILICFGFTC